LDRGTYGDQVAISGRIQDDRTPADRDQMLLELARGVAFMFAAVKRRQEPAVPVAALPAPEREVVGSDAPVDKDPI
jgi:hypothetical protein